MSEFDRRHKELIAESKDRTIDYLKNQLLEAKRMIESLKTENYVLQSKIDEQNYEIERLQYESRWK